MFIFRTIRFPRHPLARIFFAFVGLAIGLVILTFGAFLGVVFLSIGAIVWLIRQLSQKTSTLHPPFRPTPKTSSKVIEGDYVLIERGKESKAP